MPDSKETTYNVFNHNGTLLGGPLTEADANAEVTEYMYQTGNPAYIEPIG